MIAGYSERQESGWVRRSAQATRSRSRCSILEGPLAKGEFKLAEASAAGKLGRGICPVAIPRDRAVRATRPKPIANAARRMRQHSGTFMILVRSPETHSLFLEVIMKNFFAIALLSTALVSSAAYAQTAQPADRAAPGGRRGDHPWPSRRRTRCQRLGARTRGRREESRPTSTARYIGTSRRAPGPA